MSVEYVSPVARIVWGHPRNSKAVLDDRTKQPKLKKDNVTPRREITFGIAIPKADAPALYAAMQAAAAEKFPNGVPGNFAWKFKDADTQADSKGRPLREKEGQAGCLILSCRTELDSIGNFEYDHTAQKWIDCPTIKCGDHVQVKIVFDAHIAHTTNEKPGLYVNPSAVMLYKRDKEIMGAAFDPNANNFAPPPMQTPPADAPMPGAPSPGPGFPQQQAQPPQPQYNAAPAPQPNFPQAPAPQPQFNAPQAPAPQPQFPQAPVNPHTQFLSGPRPDQ